jgi:Spy/CpxP family protein refolding chaperone
MKNRKTILAASVVGLSVITAAPVIAKQSDGHNHRGEHHAHRMETMFDEVGVSDQQKAEIKQVFEGRKAGIKELKEQKKVLRGEEKSLDERVADYDQKIASLATRKGQLAEENSLWKGATRKRVALILTEEQAAGIKILREERGEKRRERRSERMGSR